MFVGLAIESLLVLFRSQRIDSAIMAWQRKAALARSHGMPMSPDPVSGVLDVSRFSLFWVIERLLAFGKQVDS